MSILVDTDREGAYSLSVVEKQLDETDPNAGYEYLALIRYPDDCVSWIGSTPTKAIGGALEARAAMKRMEANTHHNQ